MVASNIWVEEAIQRMSEDLDDEQLKLLLADLALLPGANASVKATILRMLENLKQDAV